MTTVVHIEDYPRREERRMEVLMRQPEYTSEYTTRPRTCYRPTCEAPLTDLFATFCDACRADLEAATEEIHAVIAEARRERLAREAASE